jgi:hypothetical protein
MEASTGPYPRWVAVVGALDAVAAAVLLVAGVYLLDPAAFDAGVYVEAGRYVLPGGFFVYAAGVLLVASVAGYRERTIGLGAVAATFLFGSMALIGVGVACLALGLQALFFADPWRPFVGLLVMPGLLAFVSASFSGAATAQSASPSLQTTRDSGKTQEESLATYAWSGVLGAFFNVLLIAYLGFGYLFYYLLEMILIEDVDVDFARVLFFAVPAVFESVWRLAAVLGGVMLVLLPLVGLIVASVSRTMRRARPDFERDLSEEEVSFVAVAAAQVADHVRRNALSALAGRIMAAAWIAGIGGIALGLWAMFAFEDWVAAIQTPPGGAWSYYAVDGRVLIVFMLFLVPALAFVPGSLAALWSRRRGEANGLLMIGGRNNPAAVETRIVRLLRGRNLRPGTPFEAGRFLWKAGAGLSALALAGTALFAAMFAAVWPHDRAVDTLYTEDGIETGDFWSMVRATYPYSDVAAVDLACVIESDGGTHIEYSIWLPGERRRKVVTQRALDDHLEEFARVDALLRDAGAAFRFAVPEEADSPYGLIERACVLALSEGMDEAAREKVEQVFHLDEWFERRWRVRTRPPSPPRISER